MPFDESSMFWIGGFVFFVAGMMWVMTRRTKEEKEYDEYLERSLDDEFIIDPATGAKITLEQAEKGHWIDHSNEFKVMPEEEIENLYSEEEKVFYRALNYIRASKEYLQGDLNDDEIGVLENTHILGKYDHWTFSDVYDLQYLSGRLILTDVVIHRRSYYDSNFSESQVLLWCKVKDIRGHIFIDEQSKVNKLVQRLTGNESNIESEHNVQIFTPPKNIAEVTRILELIVDLNGLELEIKDDNLFLKNLKFMNSDDVTRIEKFAKSISVQL